MASARTGAALEIRKVRKKLRQIENLERHDRDLTDEELNKVCINPLPVANVSKWFQQQIGGEKGGCGELRI